MFVFQLGRKNLKLKARRPPSFFFIEFKELTIGKWLQVARPCGCGKISWFQGFTVTGAISGVVVVWWSRQEGCGRAGSCAHTNTSRYSVLLPHSRSGPPARPNHKDKMLPATIVSDYFIPRALALASYTELGRFCLAISKCCESLIRKSLWCGLSHHVNRLSCVAGLGQHLFNIQSIKLYAQKIAPIRKSGFTSLMKF